MFVPLRSAFMVIAALTASSVAPAQANPAAEPQPAAEWTPLPELADQLLQESTDPLAPIADEEEEPQPEHGETAPGATLTETVANLHATDPGSRELECLAVGIYFEAKSESLAGQLAVGHVIANRAKSGRFPSSYCGVLFQRSQFSFIRGRSLPHVPRASRDWQDAVAIAKIVDQELHPSPVGGALFFHARRVSPRWRLTRVGTLGNHVFYR
ncbi:MAG: cell wall hydrolase [Pseudomonadota bacterium]|nr:cell wall hydrolase [Pseudomonadota bacterium]